MNLEDLEFAYLEDDTQSRGDHNQVNTPNNKGLVQW